MHTLFQSIPRPCFIIVLARGSHVYRYNMNKLITVENMGGFEFVSLQISYYDSSNYNETKMSKDYDKHILPWFSFPLSLPNHHRQFYCHLYIFSEHEPIQ